MTDKFLYKTCKKCNETKELEKYHILKKGFLGRNSICKICRKKQRKQSSTIQKTIDIKKLYLCNKCNKRKNSKNFYRNSSSKNGLQSYCKICQKKIISQSKSKLENFAKIILNKYIKKKKDVKINIKYTDIVKKFNQQKGKCYFTNHDMIHLTDIRQRTDNVWNAAIYVDYTKHNKKIVNYDDFHLTIHLIYTLTEMYQLKENQIIDIYYDLANNEIL